MRIYKNNSKSILKNLFNSKIIKEKKSLNILKEIWTSNNYIFKKIKKFLGNFLNIIIIFFNIYNYIFKHYNYKHYNYIFNIIIIIIIFIFFILFFFVLNCAFNI